MYRVASTCTERKRKKMGKPLTRLTSHVFEKKEDNLLLSFVSGFMHVHAHVYFFFKEWAIVSWPFQGGVPLDKPPGYRHMRRGESP